MEFMNLRRRVMLALYDREADKNIDYFI
jgi:hypothetical protein